MIGWEHSVWFGTTYATAGGRAVMLEAPSWIFSCPGCEYRMTANEREAIRTVRRMHARTAHPRSVPTIDKLDRESLPDHLAAKP